MRMQSNSFKGGYAGDYIWKYCSIGVLEGDTRTVENGSYKVDRYL